MAVVISRASAIVVRCPVLFSLQCKGTEGLMYKEARGNLVLISLFKFSFNRLL